MFVNDFFHGYFLYGPVRVFSRVCMCQGGVVPLRVLVVVRGPAVGM